MSDGADIQAAMRETCCISQSGTVFHPLRLHGKKIKALLAMSMSRINSSLCGVIDTDVSGHLGMLHSASLTLSLSIGHSCKTQLNASGGNLNLQTNS